MREPNAPVMMAAGNYPKAAEYAGMMVQGLANAKKYLEAAWQRQKAYAKTKSHMK